MVEIGKLCEETQSIEITPTQSTGTLRFDSPSQYMKTDRFTSLLLCFAAYRDAILKEPMIEELPGGGWVGGGGMTELSDVENELPGGVVWRG